MMMDYITLAGFILAVFGTGVAVGKIVEKIERLERSDHIGVRYHYIFIYHIFLKISLSMN